MEALTEFLAMGGYGPFVWSAYGIAAAGLIGVLVASIGALRRNERTLAMLETVRQRRREGRAPHGDDA